MTKEQLLESMQYIGDDLLEESEAPARKRRSPWPGVAAAAACFVLIAGVYFGRPQPAGGDPAALKGGDQTPPPDAVRVGVPGDIVGVPGSVNGPAMLPDAEPTVLAWNELEGAPGADKTMFFALFGQPLTAEQLAACCPEIRLEWMASLRGVGEYFGWGELYRVALTASDPACAGEIAVQLRDRDALRPPASPWDEGWTETPHTAELNGQEYRAYRAEYDKYPGEPYVWMSVVFEKENVEYTLTANVPLESEKQAAVDLKDLLLAYTGTHTVPDLSGFRYGDGVLVDQTLTPEEARADPDFGAYFPRELPEGFAEADIRRYQLADTENFLSAFFTRGQDSLNWQITYLRERDNARLTTAADRENYDLSLYPTPWADSVPPEKREIVESPVFPVGELRAEVVRARCYTHRDAGDAPSENIRGFSVLYDGGVLVRVEQVRGVSPDWLYRQLAALADG